MSSCGGNHHFRRDSAMIRPMSKSTAPGVTVLVTQLSRLIYRRTSEELLGMRVKEFATLAMLRDHSPIPQQELSEMLFIDANNLVLLLNDLESKEFAFRRRDPADRRRHLVEITGWIPRKQLYDLYRRAWAFVYPSTFEGFGMPVLEALAAGIPTGQSFQHGH